MLRTLPTSSAQRSTPALQRRGALLGGAFLLLPPPPARAAAAEEASATRPRFSRSGLLHAASCFGVAALQR
jgi:hypothetical protein